MRRAFERYDSLLSVQSRAILFEGMVSVFSAAFDLHGIDS
jgi:hypothetical protein